MKFDKKVQCPHCKKTFGIFITVTELDNDGTPII